MKSRVRVLDENDQKIIFIKHRHGSEVFLLIGLACFIFFSLSSDERVRDNPFKLVIAWGFPCLLIVGFAIWKFFAEQRICMSNNQLKVERWFGWFSLGEGEPFDVSIIDDVKIEEFGHRAKDWYFVNRVLVFMSAGKEVARSWQLSREDAQLLMSGPFKRFQKVDA